MTRSVKTKLRLAERRAIEWADVPLVQRATLVRRLADVLEEGKAGWARQMTLEMGKPIGAAEAEVQKCALGCRYAADHAAAWLADELVATEARRSFIRYEPLGVILAIMPWNFPFWQCFRFAASALMAGNVALLKHASNVPGCALAIEEIFCRAGFPDGAFQTLLVGAEGVPQLIANPRHPRGYADRQQAGRGQRGGARRRTDQEGGTGAGRQRTLSSSCPVRTWIERCVWAYRRARATPAQSCIAGQALHRP